MFSFQNCNRHAFLADQTTNLTLEEILALQMRGETKADLMINHEDSVARAIAASDYCFGLSIPNFDTANGELILSFYFKSSENLIRGSHKIIKDKLGIYDCFLREHDGFVEYKNLSTGINPAYYKFYANKDGSPSPIYSGDNKSIFITVLPYSNLGYSTVNSQFIALLKLKDVVADGFISFGSYFAKDKKNLFKGLKKFGDVNVASFDMVKDFKGNFCSVYGMDKKNVYYLGEAFSVKKISLPPANAILPFDCQKYDKKHGPNSPLHLKMSQTNQYIVDSEKVYYDKIKIGGADPGSLEILHDPNGTYRLGTYFGDNMFAKDKNSVFLYGKTELGTDPQSFRFCGKRIGIGSTVYFATILARDDRLCYSTVNAKGLGEYRYIAECTKLASTFKFSEADMLIELKDNCP
jgi:hypothetical protein